jgi:3-vinyl bacteriochlorophyllide hydratase
LQPSKSVRERREASIWTRIHPIFAIGQLGAFAVSVVLLALYFLHLASFATVYLSVLIKIAFMIGAVITGSLWEKDMYGAWWFAHEFFIEDVMTLNVFLLHAAFLVTVFAWSSNMPAILSLLGVAYGAYFLNVIQYILAHQGMKDLDDPKVANAA